MKVDGTALGVAPSTHARFYLNAQTILRKCNDICGKKCTMLSFFFHGSQQMHIVRTDAYGTDTYVVLVAQLRHLLCIRFGGTCAWVLERALTWIRQWHVSCAIYVAAIWGASLCASGVAPSMAVASMTKLHAPGRASSTDSTCSTEYEIWRNCKRCLLLSPPSSRSLRHYLMMFDVHWCTSRSWKNMLVGVHTIP